MGGITKSLFGGSTSKQASSGFNGLPAAITNAYNTLGTQANQGLTSGSFTQAFTPIAQTADETAGYDVLRNNDPMANLQSNIEAQMNPFDQYVIDGINREATGQNSLLNSALSQAGTLGSNRGILGANDIDLSRLQQIGQFKQGQYNTSLNNALTTIPQGQTDYAAGLLGIGANQRDLASQTSQAEIQALLAAAQAIGVLPTSEGSSVGKSNDSGKGIIGGLGGGAGIASLLAASDRRLKDNIVEHGVENGYKTYEFSYKGSQNRYIGVMAQDVLKTKPEAVEVMKNGFYGVNYSLIGVDFREAN